MCVLSKWEKCSKMEATDSDGSSDGDSSPFSNIEPDLIGLFRSLIRNRARMRFDTREWGLSGLYDREHLDDEATSSSEIEPEAPLKNINNSELKQETLQMSGEMCKRGYKRSNSVCKMLKKRETGVPDGYNFSGADRCFIYRRFLPNKGTVLEHYETKAFCGTHSPDGSLFVTASQDSKIRLYNSENSRYKPLKTVEARDVGWSILDTATSPDGRFLVYSSWSECIHLCSVGGVNELHEALPLSPDDRRFCVFSLVFSADGTQVLGGANDGCLYMYDIWPKKVN